MTDTDKEKPTKDLELLTCSAEFYVANQAKNIKYQLVGVDTENWSLIEGATRKECLRTRAIKKGCEVVVDIKDMRNHGYSSYLLGTGLIPVTEDP